MKPKLSRLPDIVTVHSVNFDTHSVMLEEGVILPIVSFLDSEGDECEAVDMAVVVAGNDWYGYIAVELCMDDLEPARPV